MPRDTKLWVQYCRLELMYWEKLLLRRELLGIQAMVCHNRINNGLERLGIQAAAVCRYKIYNGLGRLCPRCKAIGQ
jgi:hypothetical protein